MPFLLLCECFSTWMKTDQLLRAILPDVLIDNFDVDRFEKTDTQFDIWLDEKKIQLREDKYNKSVKSGTSCGTFLWYIHEIRTKVNVLNPN